MTPCSGRRPSSGAVVTAASLVNVAGVFLAGVVLIAAARSAAWVAPAEVVGGLGNGAANVAAGVLLGRRAPAGARGRAFAAGAAVAGGATGLGLLPGGAMLGVLSPRAGIAAAGLSGLAVTAAFAVPLARRVARERCLRRLSPDGASPQFAAK